MEVDFAVLDIGCWFCIQKNISLAHYIYGIILIRQDKQQVASTLESLGRPMNFRG